MKILKYILPILILFLAVCGWKLYQEQQVGMEKRAQELAENEAFRVRFETFLNDFLSETAQKASDYKKRRKVISELVKPENLVTAEYVEENYALMQELVPELEGKMAEIMARFEEADQDIKILLEAKKPEEQAPILEKWKSLKQEQAGTYFVFFSFEQQILNAYRELMNVYYDTHGRFTLDEEGKEIVFENVQDELNVNAKRRVVQSLLRAQAEALAEN